MVPGQQRDGGHERHAGEIDAAADDHVDEGGGDLAPFHAPAGDEVAHEGLDQDDGDEEAAHRREEVRGGVHVRQSGEGLAEPGGNGSEGGLSGHDGTFDGRLMNALPSLNARCVRPAPTGRDELRQR
jgi:hypothetical protein